MDTALETTNIDANISPIYYKGREQLLVRSMFNTVQGEMPFAGRPATFLRLGGCNRGAKLGVGCQGCDTSFDVSKSEWWDPGILANQILPMLLEGRSTPRLLVITGGEPLMQQDMFIKFFDELSVKYGTLPNTRLWPSVKVQFETNGDFVPTKSYQPHIQKAYVISPKTPFKKNPWWLNSNYTDLSLYIRRVVSGDPQSNYYEVPEEILKAKAKFALPVYLSPQTHYLPGSAQAEGESRHAINWELTDKAIRRAIFLADQHDMIVSTQWHAYANVR